MKQQYLAISCIGSDRPGLVNDLTQVILDSRSSIIDSRMTVLGEDFAMIMLISGNWDAIAKLESALEALQESKGLTIVARRSEQRATASSAMPYAVDAVAVDAPGVLHSLAGFFSARKINIEDLITNCYSAPHTGTQMFSIRITVAVPASMHISGLREEFFGFCDEMNIDAVLEPLKL